MVWMRNLRRGTRREVPPRASRTLALSTARGVRRKGHALRRTLPLGQRRVGTRKGGLRTSDGQCGQRLTRRPRSLLGAAGPAVPYSSGRCVYSSNPSSVTRGQEWTESSPEICQRAVLRKDVRRALDAQTRPASALVDSACHCGQRQPSTLTSTSDSTLAGGRLGVPRRHGVDMWYSALKQDNSRRLV